MQEPAAEGTRDAIILDREILKKINGILNGLRAKHLPNPRFRLFLSNLANLTLKPHKPAGRLCRVALRMAWS